MNKYQGQEACLDLLVHISATGTHGTCEQVQIDVSMCVIHTQFGTTYIQG